MKRLFPFLICAVLVALVIIGVRGATRQQAYQEKAARVIAANADLNYSTGRVKKDFDSLEEVARAIPGLHGQTANLRDTYEGLSGSSKTLQKFSTILKGELATVKSDQDLKPLEKAVLVDELGKIQGDLDGQIQAAKFKEKCEAEANALR